MATTTSIVKERDTRIFNLRKAGISTQEIANQLDLSTAQVSQAYKRALTRLNKDYKLSYQEAIVLELERLDALQKGQWKQTQVRRETLEDGTEVVLEPDPRAVAQVLNIMAARAKLLGLGGENVNVQVTGDVDIKSTLVGHEQPGEVIDVRGESVELIKLMAKSGVIDKTLAEKVLEESGEEIDESTGVDTGSVPGGVDTSADVVSDKPSKGTEGKYPSIAARIPREEDHDQPDFGMVTRDTGDKGDSSGAGGSDNDSGSVPGDTGDGASPRVVVMPSTPTVPEDLTQPTDEVREEPTQTMDSVFLGNQVDMKLDDVVDYGEDK